MAEEIGRGRELAGWAQIASHLGVTIPTARKWAKELGLPVVQRGRRYFAFTSELEAWRQHSPKSASSVERARPRMRRIVLVAAVAVLMVIGIRALLPSPQPVSAVFRNQSFIVLSEKGQVLWTRSLPAMEPPVLNDWSFFKDIDGDGRNEVFLQYRPRHAEEETGRLLCFGSNGKLRWEFLYGKPLKVGERAFEPYYSEMGHEWVDANGRLYLLAMARHVLWYPAQIVLLEPTTGEMVSEYWHPGFIESRAVGDIDDDGMPELLLGGINNPGHGAGYPSLAILDIPFSHGQGDPNFFGPANAKEQAYLLFPQPDVFQVEQPLVYVSELEILDHDRLISAKTSSGNDRNYLFYYLDFDLNVVDLRPSDIHRTRHNRMRNAGDLDHDFDPSELAPLRILARFSSAPNANKVAPWVLD